jgi:hypothetical protein
MAKKPTSDLPAGVEEARTAILAQRNFSNAILEETITKAITLITKAAQNDSTSVFVPYPEVIQGVKRGMISPEKPDEVKKFVRAFTSKIQELFPKDPYNVVVQNNLFGEEIKEGQRIYGANIHWINPRKTELRRNQRRRARAAVKYE